MEILNNPNETSSSIGRRLNLTRSQMNYSFKKLNDYLEVLRLEPIYRTKNGHFVVSRAISEQFGNLQKQNDIDIYLSPEERTQLIILMLLSKTDFLSMNHFLLELKVSKNTVTRDLKNLTNLLSHHQLKLEYLRSKGYRIVGEEWNRRQLLFETVNEICHFDKNELLIKRFGEISSTELQMYKAKIDQVEKSLNIRYSDDKIDRLPFFTLLLHRRISRGKRINYDFELGYAELQETKEYKVIQEVFFSKTEEYDLKEVLYFTLLFLSTNLTQVDVLSAGVLSQLEIAVRKVIGNFEKIAHIIIIDKDKLLKRIMIHMRPAYYRIKYRMHLNDVDIERQKSMGVESVFQLVKQSMKPLENFFNKEIPETEIFYLALFFGGHLLEHDSLLTKEERKKAIIVCTNGISVSMLLERSLTGIFPEIDFIETLSQREFYEGDYDVDMVFSSVPLITDNRFYLVQDFLTDEGKIQLRKKVMNDTLVGMDDFGLAEKIIDTVKMHVTISDKETLFLDILNVLRENSTINDQKNDQNLHFDQLISSDSVIIEDTDVSWHEALEILSQPLIKNKKITPQYLTAIKQEMKQIPPYIVFRNRLALPHTEPEKGALGVAMSLGIFKKGIVTEDGERIHIIVLLASNNKEKHIDALLELMDLSGREEYISKLIDSMDSTQAYKILRTYRMKYWG